MSHTEVGYIQLPPDSTGKKSAASGRLIIDFSGEFSPNILRVEDLITGQTSGATGKIVGISRVGFADGEGQLFVEVDSLSGEFQPTESIVIGPTAYATVKSTATLDSLYYQKNSIVDRDSPNRTLNINERGAANVTFTEGQPSLSSFGGLIVDEPTSVRQYVYSYDGLDDSFYEELAGAGSVTHIPAERSVVFDTGGTNIGNLAKRTSHFYHPYQPGTMMRVLHSVAVGDTGKDDVRRRWGVFDDNDGLFWELDGSELYAVVRSSTSGSAVDTRVLQSNFNVDKLDGTVRFNLDVSKSNLYWIDFQWLGVGVVRFGVYESDGSKTICHIIQNPNTKTSSYMRQGTLPIRFECENTGAAVSSSELKSICTAVQNIGKTKNQLRSNSVSSSAPRSLVQADGEVPILTVRAKTDINGITNRVTSLIDSVNVFNSDAANVVFRLRRGAFPDGTASFGTSDPSHALESDDSATGLAVDGNPLWTQFVPSGQSVSKEFLNMSESYQNDVALILLADGVTQPGICITAEVVSADASDVSVSINWKEVTQ